MISLTGSIVAIVTPMLPDGAIDWTRFDALIDWHIAEGTDGAPAIKIEIDPAFAHSAASLRKRLASGGVEIDISKDILLQ